MAGRPTKLTPAVRKTIVDAISQGGAYIETAVAHASIHKDTHYEWMRRAAEDEAANAKRAEAGKRPLASIYVEYSDAIKKAIADATLRDQLGIARAGHGQSVEARCETKGCKAYLQVISCPECFNAATLRVPGQWQALAWRLERRDPKRFGIRMRVDDGWTNEDVLELATVLGTTVEKQIRAALPPAQADAVIANIRDEWTRHVPADERA